ncbi:hypothetical protein BDY21DRAFT_102213 [Lineolata rhizophorae]|uniref:STB6-like N-terminal domain-containing protein n=1 Tax=Lineolata rhizophorae TaxID=578093 RepID=A0A6A6NSQ3_9PEZI|nr:hypothetical protein BDY21DRAFT_102213 [Lineolata rhizophorae]
MSKRVSLDMDGEAGAPRRSMQSSRTRADSSAFVQTMVSTPESPADPKQQQQQQPFSPRRADRQRFVLTDPVAFRYLEEDPSVDVLARRETLRGYECYIVEQWACSRTHPTFVITTYTGDPTHSVKVGVLSVPTDGSAWSPRLRVYYKALSQYHARRKETPYGFLMITNLSGFPSSLSVVSVPDGDVKAHRELFVVNEDLKRLGCSGRVSLTLTPPSGATQAKFHQLYRTSDKIALNAAVVELVKLCQVALSLFDKLDALYADGLLCDITEKAITDWWVEIGTDYYNMEPHDGILGPTTVAALLGLLIGARNRLNAYGAPVAKDVFDVEATKRGIAYFQKSQRLAKTRRLDRTTLDRLQRATAKAAAGEGQWSSMMPRAVKSTVAELSGKGGEMVMEMMNAGRDKAGIADVETVDIERFAQLVYGERMKWLWAGKPRKSGFASATGVGTGTGSEFLAARKYPGLDGEIGDGPYASGAHLVFREGEGEKEGTYAWERRRKESGADDREKESGAEEKERDSLRKKRYAASVSAASAAAAAGIPAAAATGKHGYETHVRSVSEQRQRQDAERDERDERDEQDDKDNERERDRDGRRDKEKDQGGRSKKTALRRRFKGAVGFRGHQHGKHSKDASASGLHDIGNEGSEASGLQRMDTVGSVFTDAPQSPAIGAGPEDSILSPTSQQQDTSATTGGPDGAIPTKFTKVMTETPQASDSTLFRDLPPHPTTATTAEDATPPNASDSSRPPTAPSSVAGPSTSGDTAASRGQGPSGNARFIPDANADADFDDILPRVPIPAPPGVNPAKAVQRHVQAAAAAGTGPLLRRTVSATGWDEWYGEGRSEERWGRRLSFSVAEEAVLRWADIGLGEDEAVAAEADDDAGSAASANAVAEKQEGSGAGDSATKAEKAKKDAAIRLALTRLGDRQSLRLRGSLAQLSVSLAPHLAALLAQTSELADQASRDAIDLSSIYTARLQAFHTAEGDAVALLGRERDGANEAVRELEGLSAKLEYEVEGLRGKVEDVEAGVEELERGVRTVEGKVGEVVGEVRGARNGKEKRRNRNGNANMERGAEEREGWLHWGMRMLTGVGHAP